MAQVTPRPSSQRKAALFATEGQRTGNETKTGERRLGRRGKEEGMGEEGFAWGDKELPLDRKGPTAGRV